MANRSGKGGSSDRFLLLGSEITVEGDCCHEIRRRLLLGRKAMTYLDSVLKSRDITLPTKVCIIKAMVFPVVIYGCESWIVKKVDSQKIGAFKLRCWKRLLRVSWTARRSNQSILKSTLNSHRKDYAEAETPVIWSSDVNNWLTGKVPDAGKDWGQEEKREKKLRWLDAITDSADVRLNKLQGIVKDGEDWRIAVHGVAKSWTWLRNWTTTGKIGLSWQLSGQESACQCRRHRFDSWFGKIPLEKEMAAHSSMLASEISWTGGAQQIPRVKRLSE